MVDTPQGVLQVWVVEQFCTAGALAGVLQQAAPEDCLPLGGEISRYLGHRGLLDL